MDNITSQKTQIIPTDFECSSEKCSGKHVVISIPPYAGKAEKKVECGECGAPYFLKYESGALFIK
jgi:hypothetical protein